MQTRSYLQRRSHSESSDRLVANLKPRSWSDPHQQQAAQPQPTRHDFSHVDLFAHDPGPRTIDFGIQPKLTVGAPNDVYEQEADRVAEQVMAMPDTQPSVQREGLPEEEEALQTKALGHSIQREAMPEEEEDLQMKPLAATITPLVQREALPEEEEELQTKPLSGSIQREALPEEEEELQTKPLGNSIQREALPEEDEELQTKPLSSSIQREALPEEEEELQTKPLGSSIQREAMPEEEEELQTKRSPTPHSPLPTPSLESRLHSSQGGGSPLPDDVRAFMEPRFGADFSQVRVHTGSEAVQMNQDLNAQAFTHKQDVYFGAGKVPGKDALTAHELTHVVQQTIIPSATEVLSKQSILQCYGTNEHVKFGGEPGKNEMVDVNGVKVSYGELVSMGDFFDKPEDMYSTPKEKLEVLVKLIRESDKRGIDPKEWNDATDGRYANLAQKNTKHFSPSNSALVTPSQHQGLEDKVDNRTTWIKYHEQALKTAESGDLQKGLAINGFADHFLTDAFAAGHLVNKPDVMAQFRDHLAKDSDSFYKAIAKKAWTNSSVSTLMSQYEVADGIGGFLGLTISSEWMFYKFLKGVDEAKPEALSSAVVKALHDKLNSWFSGIPVKNAKGDKWDLSGDDALNSRSLEIGKMAVAESRKDIHEAFNKCLAFPPYSNVLDYLPTPTEEGVKIIKGQADIFTDPNNSAPIDAVSNMIISNINLIVSEAEKLKKLRKTPPPLDPALSYPLYGPI